MRNRLATRAAVLLAFYLTVPLVALWGAQQVIVLVWEHL